jgi:formate hydrogenlyase transcriptional activator
MAKQSASPCETLAEQYQALLEVSEAIAVHRDLPSLFHDLVQRLHHVVNFEYMRLLLHDPERDVMRLHTLEMPNQSCDVLGCQELPVAESPGGWVWQHQQPLLVSDVEKETRFPRVTEVMRQQGVKSYCVVPLTTAQRRLGALGFGSLQEATYDGSDLEFLQQVANQVAVAVDNALAYQQITELKDKLTREEAYLTQAQRLTGVGSWAWDPSESHNYYSREVFNIFGLDPTKGNPTLADFLRIYHPEDREFIEEAENKLVSEGQGYDVKYRIIRPDGELRFVREVGTPVRENGVVTGFVGACMDVTEQERMTQELRREKLYLEDEIRTEYNFEEIIGESTVLKRILKQVETVAPTDSTVLIQGETGTGKELIARAIHSLSKRGERTFVKMNCAAIPTGLLESELFGHERGAFTGAIAQKVGRFELAHGGTLFLDEVGDVPLELQSKLLRVLQEQEFERLGSNRTIRVDVRLVAATNRDLAQMVTDKQFRSDLYYRLNVFPITAPPLRERPEDIPLLVRYFAQKYARLMNKRIETIPAEAMTALAKYHWPGNIRELENLIERSVILSQGPDLHVPLAELKAPAAAALNGAATLEAAEREHILRVLRETNWVIGGSSGAAARLGMKRTTLQSKITKLGISRRS